MQYNIRHLLSALEIQRHGTVTEASEQVHLSQSALTQGISKLETQLENKLFERSNSGMYSTDIGELFLDRVQRAFAYLESFAQHLFEKDKHRRSAFIRNVTSRQLKALKEVSQYGSYTTAAAKMGLTQPTLGKTIKDLERLTQITLFTRIPTGVEPTWRARLLARYASLFFSELNQGMEEIQKFLGQRSGELRIGSLPLARSSIVPRAVTQLLAETSDMKVTILDGSYEALLHDLMHGHIDIIVGALRYPPPHEDVEQHCLLADPLSIVTRKDHPLEQALQQSSFCSQILTASWIAPRPDAPARAVFDGLFTDKGHAVPSDIIECSSMVVIRGLLMNSDRLALLPARQVEVEVDSGLLSVAPQPLAHSMRDIGYSVRKNWKPTPAHQRFVEVLSQIMKED